MILKDAEWMQDLLIEHVEELESLGARRLEARQSPAFNGRALAALQERVDAHVDALVLAGEDALPHLLLALRSEKPESVLAAALPLLRMGSQGAAYVLEQLDLAGTKVRHSLRWALFLSPLGTLRPLLEKRARGPVGPVSTAATQVLAFHGVLEELHLTEPAFVSPNAAVRAGAFRTVMWAGAKALKAADAQFKAEWSATLLRGLEDPTLSVRQAAWKAAAWTRQPWLMAKLREQATRKEKSAELLPLLALLGAPEDETLFVSAAQNPAMGDARFLWLATWGFAPAAVELLRALESGGGKTAALAAQAFQRLMDVDVETQIHVEEGLDLRVPHFERARVRVESVQKQWKPAERWLQGKPEASWTGPLLADLDRQTYAGLRLRQGVQGSWTGLPAQLDLLDT